MVSDFETPPSRKSMVPTLFPLFSPFQPPAKPLDPPSYGLNLYSPAPASPSVFTSTAPPASPITSFPNLAALAADYEPICELTGTLPSSTQLTTLAEELVNGLRFEMVQKTAALAIPQGKGVTKYEYSKSEAFSFKSIDKGNNRDYISEVFPRS
jgi:hypothetical protein